MVHLRLLAVLASAAATMFAAFSPNGSVHLEVASAQSPPPDDFVPGVTQDATPGSTDILIPGVMDDRKFIAVVDPGGGRHLDYYEGGQTYPVLTAGDAPFAVEALLSADGTWAFAAAQMATTFNSDDNGNPQGVTLTAVAIQAGTSGAVVRQDIPAGTLPNATLTDFVANPDGTAGVFMTERAGFFAPDQNDSERSCSYAAFAGGAWTLSSGAGGLCDSAHLAGTPCLQDGYQPGTSTRDSTGDCSGGTPICVPPQVWDGITPCHDPIPGIDM